MIDAKSCIESCNGVSHTESGTNAIKNLQIVGDVLGIVVGDAVGVHVDPQQTPAQTCNIRQQLPRLTTELHISSNPSKLFPLQVGANDGVDVGKAVVGRIVGSTVGFEEVGDIDGNCDGVIVGTEEVGELVGADTVGDRVGLVVGALVVGLFVGESDGKELVG